MPFVLSRWEKSAIENVQSSDDKYGVVLQLAVTLPLAKSVSVRGMLDQRCETWRGQAEFDAPPC